MNLIYTLMPRLFAGMRVKKAPSHQIGPGQKTLHTYHKNVGRGKTYPVNGKQACERRMRQIAKGQLRPENRGVVLTAEDRAAFRRAG